MGGGHRWFIALPSKYGKDTCEIENFIRLSEPMYTYIQDLGTVLGPEVN